MRKYVTKLKLATETATNTNSRTKDLHLSDEHHIVNYTYDDNYNLLSYRITTFKLLKFHMIAFLKIYEIDILIVSGIFRIIS